MSVSEILSETKAIKILEALRNQPNNIRGIHRIVGGSLSTIIERVKSLQKADLIQETEGPGKFLKLTKRGESVIAVCKWMDTPSPVLRKVEITKDEPKKWILVLLHSLGEIKGSTRLEKLLFLLKEKFEVVDKPFYKFEPYYFGPFSVQILEDVRTLRDMGLIEIENEVFEPPSEFSDAIFVRKAYRLTEDGRAKAKEVFKDTVSRKPEIGKALFCLREYNSMPLSNLLNHIYTEYPQYSPPPDLP